MQFGFALDCMAWAEAVLGGKLEPFYLEWTLKTCGGGVLLYITSNENGMGHCLASSPHGDLIQEL